MVSPYFHTAYFRVACALALAASAAGCATVDDIPTQQLEIHTILDHREVAGVGCVLSSDVGRWFVVAPGRVTVQRSRDPLTVDCARQGTGSAVEVETPHSAALIDTDKLIGKVIVGAGIGGYVHHEDAGDMTYQPILTVLMHPAQAPDEQQTVASNNVLF